MTGQEIAPRGASAGAMAQLRAEAEKCSPKERKALDALCDGARSLKAASLEAGCSPPYLSRVIGRDRCRAYLMVRLTDGELVLKAMAAGVVARLMHDAESEAVQLNAAIEARRGAGGGSRSGASEARRGAVAVRIDIGFGFQPDVTQEGQVGGGGENPIPRRDPPSPVSRNSPPVVDLPLEE